MIKLTSFNHFSPIYEAGKSSDNKLTPDQIQTYLKSNKPELVSQAMQIVQKFLNEMIYVGDYNEVEAYISSDGLVNIESEGDWILEPFGFPSNRLPIKFGVVNCSLELSNWHFESLEGSPHLVMGDFKCNECHLTNLHGAPRKILRNFSCQDNSITSLEGGPEFVGNAYNCSFNKLTDLHGLPTDIILLDCNSNQLTTLQGAPKDIVWMDCETNNLKNLKGAPKKFDLICFDLPTNVKHPKLKKLYLAYKLITKGYFTHTSEEIDDDNFVNELNNFINVEVMKDSERFFFNDWKKNYLMMKDFFEFQEDFMVWDSNGKLIKENLNLFMNWLDE